MKGSKDTDSDESEDEAMIEEEKDVQNDENYFFDATYE